jgi:hypothetical protein
MKKKISRILSLGHVTQTYNGKQDRKYVYVIAESDLLSLNRAKPDLYRMRTLSSNLSDSRTDWMRHTCGFALLLKLYWEAILDIAEPEWRKTRSHDGYVWAWLLGISESAIYVN